MTARTSASIMRLAAVEEIDFAVNFMITASGVRAA